jgi:hypothetical protein
MFMWLSQGEFRLSGVTKQQAPPGQACLANSILGGRVRVQINQLVILRGMNQAAKFDRNYSTQTMQVQALQGGIPGRS